MALTEQQQREAGRHLASQLFPPNVTAHLNLDDLKAAIQAIDEAMHTVMNNIPVGARTNTILQLFVLNLPEPFKSNSSAAQKAMALSLWALKESGAI